MAERERSRGDDRRQDEDDAVVEATPVESVDIDEIDDLLDEIDSVLEENAEEFVKNYVQKGGE